jgi:hypothetical protein
LRQLPPPLSLVTPPSTPSRPRVMEHTCAEPRRAAPRRRSRWEPRGRAAGHPPRRRAPRRPPDGRRTNTSYHGQYRGVRGNDHNHRGGAYRARVVERGWGHGLGYRLVSSEKLHVSSGTPGEERGEALGASTRRCRRVPTMASPAAVLLGARRVVLAELSCRLQSRARCPNPRQRRHRVSLEHVATRCLVERRLKHLSVNTAGMRGVLVGIC